jgi:hydrogenase expression/formation protein HypE
MSDDIDSENLGTLSCPAPIREHTKVLLAHGGGGRLMHELIEKTFVATFGGSQLAARHDGALLELDGTRYAFTTDSYVVRPLFFPGGNIGTLAVNGTVNDLAMCGAKPLYLSCGFIVEEGFPMETLWRVVQSMQRSAEQAGVEFVTGDTKVVDKGKGDGIFINTAGLGVIEHKLVIGPQSVQTGDMIILNGDLGRHGIAIMAEREGLAFETSIESDCAPLCDVVLQLLSAGVEVHCLRDLTRGGLGSAVIEIAETARKQISLEETRIPVSEDVSGACEMLGLDPLFVANEGRFVALVPQAEVERALSILRAHPLGAQASVIGTVTGDNSGLVTLKTRLGISRIMSMLSGEQLPRIC